MAQDHSDDIPLDNTESVLIRERLVAGSREVYPLTVTPNVQVAQYPKRDRILHVSRLALTLFMSAQVGMSDGSLGAQLTSIQSHYNLSYSVVSLIFLANIAGWFFGTFLNIYLQHHIGLWRTFALVVY